MPIIKSIQRWEFGRQASPLVKTTAVEVDSLEEFTFTVEGAERGETSAKKKTSKSVRKLTITPGISNAKFLAIYNKGQGSGLRIKVGGSNPVTLIEPIIYMDRSAARFSPKTTIVLENDSATSKSAVMLVGSNLPKNARKSELIRTAPVKKKKGPAKKKAAVKR